MIIWRGYVLHRMLIAVRKGVGRMQNRYNPTWDLDVIFPGGSHSTEYEQYLKDLDQDITHFRALSKTESNMHRDSQSYWLESIDTLQNISKRLRHASAFVGCLTAQNVKDDKAKLLSGRIKQLYASFASVMTIVDAKLIQLSKSEWDTLLGNKDIEPIAFPLEERRRRANDKLSPEMEALVGDLAVDGYHGWSDLYNAVVGRMTIPYDEGDKTSSLSVGQAANKMQSSNREIRKEVFSNFEKAWSEEAELCANALNHLAGFRVNLYRHRGWDSILKEPLDINRMSQQTLNVMWEVIDRNKDLLVRYMERKAKLLGLEKLSWHDVDAPIGSASNEVSYDEAAAFIIEHFERFSPKMADFTVKNFKERWIEAEDRPGKRPGGFCTSFPDNHQSRIFMTFSGTASNVSTLAHELGHAYHQHVMNDLPTMAQGYAMNVAETASTFAEMIVADASVKHAASADERLVLLEDKIQRSVAFFMNIHARFIFENNFYDERKKGLVSVERLNELMTNAQKKAYKDSLSEYHPHFWASKLHFYSTGVPFYNFPYTFGYLFSAGIYAKALEEGTEFEDKYINLLRDTGRMQVEDLAAKHLGVDLTKEDFWQNAVNLTLADIEEFLTLTE